MGVVSSRDTAFITCYENTDCDINHKFYLNLHKNFSISEHISALSLRDDADVCSYVVRSPNHSYTVYMLSTTTLVSISIS